MSDLELTRLRDSPALQLVRESGADQFLRHSDPAITTEVYGHLKVKDMRRGVNQLAFQVTQPAEAPELAAKHAPRPLRLVCCWRVTGETGFEPVDMGCPKPATAHAFRSTVSESGHFESTGQSSVVPPVPPRPLQSWRYFGDGNSVEVDV